MNSPIVQHLRALVQLFFISSALFVGWCFAQEAPVVTVDAAVSAAEEPNWSGTFIFWRTGSTAASLTANISDTGTATSGTDFTALGTTVVFAAGSDLVTKFVTPIEDTIIEPPETLIVTVVAGTVGPFRRFRRCPPRQQISNRVGSDEGRSGSGARDPVGIP